MAVTNSTRKKEIRRRAKKGAGLEFIGKAVSAPGSDCILWPETWVTTGKGYGRISYCGGMVVAHRLALSLYTGVPLDTPLDASHGDCHNRRCINPLHLSWKTRAENMADTVRDGTRIRGEQHEGSKLTERDVRAIRAAEGLHKAIAKKYGISRTVVTRIKNRTRWGWLE